MAQKNTVEIDFANSPDLQKIFAHKEPGDTCEFEVSVVINEIDEKGLKASIKKITSDYGGKDEEIAEPSVDEPVSIKIMPMPSAEKAYG